MGNRPGARTTTVWGRRFFMSVCLPRKLISAHSIPADHRRVPSLPKWSKTQLLELPIAERQFEASRQYGLRPAQANLNLAVCLLQSVNQLTPASPAPRFQDTWKMLIGAELNCLGAVRGYVAGALPPTQALDPVQAVLRECAGQASFSAPEIARAKPQTLKDMVRGAVAALWLWKTGQSPFERPHTDWEALLNEFSGGGIWTRDVTLKQRSLFISELAQYLVSERAKSQPVGLGPQVFDASSAQAPAPAALADESDAASTSNRLTQEVMAKPISQPTIIQSDATTRPVVDTLDLYLHHALPPTPDFIPAEWRAIIASASSQPRTFICGGVGSGKTQVLYVIAHELRQAGQVPLYLRVSDYARYAADMDIIQFAATAGEFWQTFQDESLSREFAKALAEAQRADRLVLLADQCDDLFENEWPNVSHALNRFQRLILAERIPHLPLDRTASATINMPTLSVPALIDLARVKNAPILTENQLVELQEQGIEITPAIMSVVAEIVRTTGDLHPVTIMHTWINDLIRQARSTEALVAALDKVHKLLPELARIRQRLAWPRGEANDLSDDTVIRIFRDPTLELRDQAEGRTLLDFCVRTGLLARNGTSWQFTSPAFERFFAAEYATREIWTSLWPRQRKLMAWTTALLMRQGSHQQQERFFAQLKSTMERVTDLSALEAMDILAAAGVDTDLPAATIFKEEVLRRFKDLAKVESESVQYAVQLSAKRLGLKVGLAREVERPPDLIPGDVLDDYARDLPELLRQLGMKPPKGREDQWLENRIVLNALIEELRTHPDPIIRHQCAAWLRRASLSKVTEIQIPSQPLKSRLVTALEVLAGIANDSAEDTFARVLARSVLAQDEFVLQLWKSRAEYIPLVYELLLAMDRRLFSTRASLGKQDWYIAG
jgi:hypothetical protein